ncbi:MAG: hypothetical protein QOG21_2084 [Actinomycetota bacterium]|nr:hypothetical protein [Actinomycetota bacterium]
MDNRCATVSFCGDRGARFRLPRKAAPCGIRYEDVVHTRTHGVTWASPRLSPDSQLPITRTKKDIKEIPVSVVQITSCVTAPNYGAAERFTIGGQR